MLLKNLKKLGIEDVKSDLPKYFVVEELQSEGVTIKHCIEILGDPGFTQVLLIRSLTSVSFYVFLSHTIFA